MNKVCIVGCGNVGMAFAHEVAMRGEFVEELCLIDIDDSRAKGEALDLSHTMAFASNLMTIKQGHFGESKDADVVVITAGRNQSKGGETRQDLVKLNAKIVSDCISECEKAGFQGVYIIATNPVDVVTYVALSSSGISENRIFGSGTTLDTARLKCVLGEKLKINPKSINAYVLGEHGDSEFVAWTLADISGSDISNYLTNEEKDEIEKSVKNSAYEIIEQKGYTNFGVGTCLFELTKAVLCNENVVYTVSTLNDEMDMCYSVPCIIGKDGIQNKLLLKLGVVENQKLNQSISSLKACYNSLKK